MKQHTKKIYVCYHESCLDGFTAAWIAWRKFKDKAIYIPLPPDTLPKEGIKNATIYFLDLCPRGNKLDILKKRGNRIVVIDHHVSSTEFAKHAHEALFDIRHSGAVLAWKYFFSQKKLPLLAHIAEDVDLWKFELSSIREILSYINSLPFSFALWNRLSRELSYTASRQRIRQKGVILLAYQKQLIQMIVAQKSVPVLFETYSTYAVNAPFFQSEVGELLCKNNPPLGIIWSEAHDGIRVSLRSRGSLDVSKLAKKYGGGGHRNSAGFLLAPGKKIPWKRRSEKKKSL